MTALSAGLVATLTAIAVPAGAVPVPVKQAPEAVCRVTDKRLVEISGLVADGSGYVVVNDGADEESGRRIFFLNRSCKVVRAVPYPASPRDTEDLARAADGTLWVGDIGDNGQNRDNVGVWRLAPGARAPKLFRMSYPDGPHDAEALLVAGNGTPVVVTKDPLTAGVYVPDGPLQEGRTTPLRRAGAFRIPLSGTGNPFGFRGRLVVTGGAVSPDGRRVLLRTYADAFEFDVPADGTTADGVVRAITGGTPRTVALPDEPQGESITYTADGTALLTVSEVTETAADIALLRYPLPEAPAPTPAVSSEAYTSSLSVSETARGSAAPEKRIPTGAVVAGLTLAVAAAAVGVVVARRRRNHGS
ncbi:hypothetical protein QLQ12_16505 [Actinoplanes sp. NEAU-A12]|uniref:Esterase-like activity of phytase family protein n=1 Tax=Actinoplanes sandaracinus TaxID=3045177 RepID=A0ABT6WKG0_9ACTN|nr:hypothetical protein [Actinoplanes sandaracinus]MDI6100207.1 hypothetical protein [Actinoplanes sandaracinus]